MRSLDRGLYLWYPQPRASSLLLCLVVLLGICRVDVAAAADALQLVRKGSNGYEITLHKSGVIQLSRSAKTVSVGNPEIADIKIVDEQGRQLYVVGTGLGTTNVVVWDKQDRMFGAFDIEVTHDLESLKRKLNELLSGERIEVRSAQGKLFLSGGVSSVVKMQAALDLAQGFLPPCEAGGEAGAQPAAPTPQEGGQAGGGQGHCPSVVNMMQVGGAQQVMLEVKVAEIARSVLKRLDSDVNILLFGTDLKAGAVSGGATFPDALFDIGDATDVEIPLLGGPGQTLVGPSTQEFQPNTPAIDDKGLVLSGLAGDFLFQAVLDVSRQKGLAKILAEPVLTTITGQEAQFLSGGEFPIPVAQDLGQVTIVFKEFGVGVKFLPVVLDSGHINLKLNVSVSELSTDVPVVLGLQGTAATFAIPSLTKRSAQSSVELADGQTIGIAGLINDSLRESIDKFPGLGDVPLFGTLFRSQEFRSGQTELVMFVTPHVAKPIAASQVRLPTDSLVPPDDLEFYLMGRIDAREAPTSPPAPPASPSATQSVPNEAEKFGHGL